MPTYGLTATGLSVKSLETIDDEVDQGLRSILGDSAGTDADGKIPLESMAGQLKALIVDGLAAQWDLMEAVHASLDPNKAAGVFQDSIAALTGTTRNAARNSVATGLCVGDPGTSLPVGRAATVDGTSSRFSTATGFAIATGTAYTPSGSYLVGDLRYIPGQDRHYLCVATGIGSGSGPSGTAASITAGGATWKYLGEGIGVVHAPFVADVIGAIGVATGSLNAIATPVSGWEAVYNLLAGEAGALQETDAALRTRRNQELAATGNTTADAIRANILAVNAGSEDVNHLPPLSCTVFFNDTDLTDSNGVPPHSVECLVQDGTTGDIAQAIWDSVGAGTRTYGSTSATATDSEGNDHAVYFTRPTEVPIYVRGVGRYDAREWPDGSDSLVGETMESALLTYTASWPPAKDVRTSPLIAAIMRGPAGTTGGVALVPAPASSDPVPGLLELETFSISTASGTTGTAQISISGREIAIFDASTTFLTATSEEI
jgi:uncharacterized phage protein gp47/JayE